MITYLFVKVIFNFQEVMMNKAVFFLLFTFLVSEAFAGKTKRESEEEGKGEGKEGISQTSPKRQCLGAKEPSSPSQEEEEKGKSTSKEGGQVWHNWDRTMTGCRTGTSYRLPNGYSLVFPKEPEEGEEPLVTLGSTTPNYDGFAPAGLIRLQPAEREILTKIVKEVQDPSEKKKQLFINLMNIIEERKSAARLKRLAEETDEAFLETLSLDSECQGKNARKAMELSKGRPIHSQPRGELEKRLSSLAEFAYLHPIQFKQLFPETGQSYEPAFKSWLFTYIFHKIDSTGKEEEPNGHAYLGTYANIEALPSYDSLKSIYQLADPSILTAGPKDDSLAITPFDVKSCFFATLNKNGHPRKGAFLLFQQKRLKIRRRKRLIPLGLFLLRCSAFTSLIFRILRVRLSRGLT